MLFEWKIELKLRKYLGIINYFGLIVENLGTVDF